MRIAIACIGVMAAAGVAAADSSEPPERLVVHARELARAHDCAGARVVAAQVAEANAELYADEVLRDPEIGPCVTSGPVLSPAQVVESHTEVVPPGGKSPSTALALSAGVSLLGGTLSLLSFVVGTPHGAFDLGVNKPLAIIGGSIALIGPSTGNIYAGNTLNAGLGIRVVGLGIMGATIAHCGSSCSSSDSTANAMLVVASLVYAAGVYTEIALAPRAARRYNREHFQVVPAPMSTGRDVGAGLVLSGHW